MRAWRPSKPPERYEKEGDEEEKKVDADDEEKMEGMKRDKDDMQDSLVMEECSMVSFAISPLPLQLLL